MTQLKFQKVLAIVPMHNAHGKKDVTGAFMPEAKKFVSLARAGEVVQFDNSKDMPHRRNQVLLLIKDRQKLGFSSIAFFCHGWLDGIQAGFTRRQAPVLAAAIKSVIGTSVNDPVIPLYCCSTGEDPQDDPLTAAGTGDDSFADKLRDAMCLAGMAQCRTMGHTTVAHTTMNPMVLFMDGMGVPEGGVGGYPPVSPKSAHWTKWKAALRGTDLRFRMPYMTPAEIHAELSAE